MFVSGAIMGNPELARLFELIVIMAEMRTPFPQEAKVRFRGKSIQLLSLANKLGVYISRVN
jgi:hypothetical protein